MKEVSQESAPESEKTDSEEEYVRLLTEHQDSIRAFITSMMPGRPDVADVVQETNTTLWKKRNRFEMGTNFTAWALSNARFAVLGHRRKLKKENLFIYDCDLLSRVTPEVEELAPDRLRNRQAALETCLGKLSPPHRELVEQRYSGNSTIEEYALSKGKSANSLRVTLFRLRATLRKCIQRQLILIGQDS